EMRVRIDESGRDQRVAEVERARRRDDAAERGGIRVERDDATALQDDRAVFDPRASIERDPASANADRICAPARLQSGLTLIVKLVMPRTCEAGAPHVVRRVSNTIMKRIMSGRGVKSLSSLGCFTHGVSEPGSMSAPLPCNSTSHGWPE